LEKARLLAGRNGSGGAGGGGFNGGGRRPVNQIGRRPQGVSGSWDEVVHEKLEVAFLQSGGQHRRNSNLDIIHAKGASERLGIGRSSISRVSPFQGKRKGKRVSGLNRAGFRRPFKSHAVVAQQFLEILEQSRRAAHFARNLLLRQTKRGQRACGLADVPFDRM